MRQDGTKEEVGMKKGTTSSGGGAVGKQPQMKTTNTKPSDGQHKPSPLTTVSKTNNNNNNTSKKNPNNNNNENNNDGNNNNNTSNKKAKTQSGDTTKQSWEKRLNALFCPQCGTILSLPEDLKEPCVKCAHCGYKENQKVLAGVTSISIVESTRMRQKASDGQHRAIINDQCPTCGHNKLYFWTAQLRSADEGQTVFYECVKCKHNWKVDS